MKTFRALLRATAMLSLSAGGLRADSPAGLLATIEQFDHLTLGNTVTVGSVNVMTGNLQCRLTSGHAAPVLAGEAPVGFFFEGRGEMEYLSVDAVEAPLVTFNAKKASGLKPEKTGQGVRLRDQFTRLLWIAPGQAVPQLSAMTAATPALALSEQRAKFSRVFDAPLSYDFAMQRLDGGGKSVVRVEMDGGEEDLVYERSEMEDPRERLMLLRSSFVNHVFFGLGLMWTSLVFAARVRA